MKARPVFLRQDPVYFYYPKDVNTFLRNNGKQTFIFELNAIKPHWRKYGSYNAEYLMQSEWKKLSWEEFKKKFPKIPL